MADPDHRRGKPKGALLPLLACVLLAALVHANRERIFLAWYLRELEGPSPERQIAPAASPSRASPRPREGEQLEVAVERP